MREPEQPIKATGSASLHISEAGQTIEVNSPLAITVNDSCRWQGRPENEPVESRAVEVRQFIRKAVYSMKPTPTPRPIRPVPKPRGKKERTTLPTAATRCPLCNGEGWFGDHATIGAAPCELCDGVGLVTQAQARDWLEDHD